MQKGIILLILLMMPFCIQAHEDDKQTGSNKQDTAKQETTKIQKRTQNDKGIANNSVFAKFEDFPNLHPLIVHFPIVLLLISFVSQFISLFVFKEALGWTTLILLLGSFIGALIATFTFHPHVEGLPDNILKIFQKHEQLANWTIWLSGISLFLKSMGHFVFNRKLWIEILTLLVITASAVTVNLTGHLGSQMVFIKDVGPKGNYLLNHE